MKLSEFLISTDPGKVERNVHNRASSSQGSDDSNRKSADHYATIAAQIDARECSLAPESKEQLELNVWIQYASPKLAPLLKIFEALTVTLSCVFL